MTTARDIVNDAAAVLGLYAEDVALSDTSAQILLRDLNRMLDSASRERLMLHVVTLESLTLAANTASYASSLLASGRPSRVTGFTITLSGTTTVGTMINEQEYDDIGYKAATGCPTVCYASMAYPTATFYFYPTPDQAYTAHLTCERPLTSALSLSTSISMPPGYEHWMVSELAMTSAGKFGAQVTPEMMRVAAAARSAIKHANVSPIPTLTMPFAVRRGDIYAGE